MRYEIEFKIGEKTLNKKGEKEINSILEDINRMIMEREKEVI